LLLIIPQLNHKGQPTVILAKTIKGYGLGESGEGKNITHQQKKLNEDELREFRSRFGIPISDEDVRKAPFYRPDEESHEIKYLKRKTKKSWAGLCAIRKLDLRPIKTPPKNIRRIL
jgi:pyruvate dehydrogenase E1 component